jgi:putative ATP-binding cassette transporter
MQTKARLTRLALSCWLSREAPAVWVLTLLAASCTCIIVLLNMLLNKWQAGFYTQLQQYNFSGFIDSLLEFGAFSAVLILASGYQSHFRMRLEIRWRHWLTDRFIDMWLRHQTYYRLNLQGLTINPEQRISEDINLFVKNTLDLAIGLLRHTLMLVVFSAVLWQLSGLVHITVAHNSLPVPGYLVWLALLYSTLGTCLTIRVGRPLIFRNILQQTHEAHFRSGLARIKEHDECVALYGGEPTEKLHLARQFQKIVQNYLHIARSTKLLTLVSSSYSQLSIVFAFLVASPRYFNDEIQLGQLFEISGAYWYVHSALSYIVDSFGKFALWKAVASRLDNFNSYMAETHHAVKITNQITLSRNNHVKLKNLTVLSSSGRLLLKDLTLDIRPQDKLLISGSLGCGKTTLLKTMAGIWPYFSGTIIKPQNKTVMFLPQKPYIPPGSLRNALLYPNFRESQSDAKLHEALHYCSLEKLVGRLDENDEWGKILSLGEQQCLAFVRVIVQHPDWLFLDEATSSMDEPTERRLYALLERVLPALTLVSVGHRETLRLYHTVQLNLAGDGAWHSAPLAQPDAKPVRRRSITTSI